MNSALREALQDSSLSARVIKRIPLVYCEGASRAEDRPPFVRAASGLGAWREYLIAVQDDANWLALIDSDRTVRALPLPRGPDGARIFDDEHGNARDKVDLEACVVLPREKGFELVAFGSGTGAGTEWILRATCDQPGAAPDIGFEARFCGASDFFASLRQNQQFSGGRVNIEGAVALDADRIMLLQRGNAPQGEGEPVDATAELSWRDLCAHLHEGAPPPALKQVRPYDLGELNGVRLTFSDAEKLEGGGILYSASAEDAESGRIVGSVLGVIDTDGAARWCKIVGEDGAAFTSKIEGLTIDARTADTVCFVIDDDDAHAPSELFLAKLGGGFLGAG